MKRIYLFIFLSIWMFAACSTTGDTVKETDSGAVQEAENSTDSGAVKETESSSEVFHHKGAGFSMTKPGGWNYLSPEIVKAASESKKWDDAELQKMIKENPKAPLVVITRYQEPYPTLNPNVDVRVVHIPVAGITPKDILNMSTEALKSAYPDMTYVDEVQDTKVDGIDGAYAKIKYTIAAGERKFPTMTRIWMVPRGQAMFTVGMSGPQEGPDVSEEYFKEILSSIKIEQ
jgi:hypothetical protein